MRDSTLRPQRSIPLKPQDIEIGWNRAMCAKRLKLIANNRRFTILDKEGGVSGEGKVPVFGLT